MNSSIEFSVLIERALLLYRAYFQKFLVFGVAGAIVANLLSFLPVGAGTGIDNMELIKAFISLILAFVQFKITVSIVLLIRDSLNGDQVLPNKSFSESSSYYWDYVLTSFFLGLRMLVIFIPLGIIAAIFQTMVAYVVVCTIGIVAIFYVLIHYMFAPMMRVLNPEVSTPFSSTFNMVRNYRWEMFLFVVVIIVISGLIPMINYFIKLPFPLNAILDTLLSTIIFPFSNIVMVLFYYNLVDIQPENQTQTELS